MRKVAPWITRCLVLTTAIVAAPAQAWGDDGHRVIALIADHYLTPVARAKVAALLAGPALPDQPNDPAEVPGTIAERATWADKYRDSDRRQTPDSRYMLTRQWHFVDMETDAPDLDAACFGHPGSGPPFPGRPDNCVVDKIKQFRDQLADPVATPDQKVIAFDFLLHFVGDVHQPLHAADHHDSGGNAVTIRYVPTPPVTGGDADGMVTTNLHSYWDKLTVSRLGSSPAQIAQALIAGMPKHPSGSWATADPAVWAREAFALAKSKAYTLPPASIGTPITLTTSYAKAAATAARKQLQRAGYRLAQLLNAALS